MSDEQRIIARAIFLMQTKGYGWSKALDYAARTMKPSDTPRDAAEGDDTPKVKGIR